MEYVEGVILSCILLLPYIALIIAGSPRRSASRLRIHQREPLSLHMPDICAVTGEPATESHDLACFSSSGIDMTQSRIAVPFSESGWRLYTKKRPASITVWLGGLGSFMKLPIVGATLGIILWLPFAGFPCGIIAVIELLFGRRPLVKLHKLNIVNGTLYGIDISVASRDFAVALIDRTLKMTLPDFEAKQGRWIRRNRWIAVAAVLGLVGWCVWAYLKHIR